MINKHFQPKKKKFNNNNKHSLNIYLIFSKLSSFFLFILFKVR